MTTQAPNRNLHPRELQLLDALEHQGTLTKRDLLTLRTSYLRAGSIYTSLLPLLRERGYPEEQLASALRTMGIQLGGEGATPDPLHPLVIEQNVPYLPPEEITLTEKIARTLTFDKAADALIHLGTALTDEQYQTPEIEKLLLAQGVIDEETYSRAGALWKGLDFIDLRRTPPNPQVRSAISENIITTQSVIPFTMDDGVLVVAASDPTIMLVRNMIEDQTGERPRMVLAPPSQIRAHIEATYERDRAMSALKDESNLREESKRQRTSQEDILQGGSADNSAVSNFVDQMLREASVQNASDIHIQPTAGETVIRLRIDGLLTHYKDVPKNMHRAIVNRIRSMGGLNNAHERKPQDAVIRYRDRGLEFNLRCNIVPLPHGGKVALRLARPPSSIPTLDHADLSEANLRAAEWALQQSNGMIVMSGPTGSGKTVFSHTMIQHINHPDIAIFTIENPIEIEMPGLIQIQINPEVPNEELRTDYPDILRALLRQDPDVIMIGEVRDLITARTAVQAAQTGHLMITTIHSNSAAGVITRLIDMGIETFNLSASLRLLIAQRLAGRPCPDCRTKITTPAHLFDSIGGGPATITETTGRMGGSHDTQTPICPTCKGSGVSGRIAIHEMIRVTPRIEQAIRDRAGEQQIEQLARKDGFSTLWEDGLRKIRNGETTLRLLSAIHSGEETPVAAHAVPSSLPA
ncbi:GspE/PulE family protein [Deinococcus ruber]|uniref:Bacterial type II secretion system protein E domain-containing protein n=1 Tax=Deinococcus ruber TaxID=1848197 RepID=A0A918C874_9DEIO|nr:GspE/PulE family protein [Deinococcus ruber]GGR10106.1 hypothetical protein GCM10008957_23640 [Deinococcus ruber]